MKKFILCLCLLSIVTACASLREVQVPSSITDSNNIVILRNSSTLGSSLHFWPTLNGIDIAGMHTQQYLQFGLPEGSYKIGVRCYGGIITKWHHYEIDVQVRPQETKYFIVSPYSLGCAEIEEINKKQAMVLVEQATLIRLGDIATCPTVGGTEIKTHCR